MAETYLITGGAGNLACQLTFELARRAGRIILFDTAPSPLGAVAPGCVYVRGDLTDTAAVDALVSSHRPTIILHFASLLSGSCEKDRARCWRVNMDGAFELFEIALRRQVRQIFFPSSVATYGGTLPDPLPEDFAQWPDGIYGVTKVATERLGTYYRRRHGLDFRCLRLPIVVSAHAPAGAASAYASHAFVESVRRGRFTFRVRPQTCAATLYVKDVLRAIDEFIHAPADGLRRCVYNLGGIAPTAAALADAIRARRGDVQIEYQVDEQIAALIEGWPRQIDDSAAHRDWGWARRFDLDAMADDFMRELTADRGD